MNRKYNDKEVTSQSDPLKHDMAIIRSTQKKESITQTHSLLSNLYLHSIIIILP